MSTDVVLLDVNEGIATITINRPEVLNAINYDVLNGLSNAIDQVAADAAVKVVLIKGAGDRAFVAGADISILNDFDAFSGKQYCETGQALFARIEALPKPVIACVNGYAFGGGCELALACDLRIASAKAKLALPEVTLGVIPGFGGTQRLPRLVGTGHAKQLIFTGKPVTAEQALTIGLVNEVVAPEELDARCLELATTITQNSAVAISFAKAAINEGMQMELHRAIAAEAVQFAVNFTSPDRVEGITAFLEKRKPSFTGLSDQA